jgi:outer membrane protein TolC
MFNHPLRSAAHTRRSLACRAAHLATALCLGLDVTAQAQPTLSLDDALQRAQQRSLQLSAQDSAATAARELAAAAGRLPDPTLKAGINNLPLNGPDAFSLSADFMTMRSIGVMQEFTREDKRKARAARFDRQADVAEAGRALALANLRRDTALAWLERHYVERMVELLKTQRAEAALQIEAADAAYRGGKGALADLFAARSAVAQIDDRIRQAETLAATAQTRLQRWVGADAPRTLAAPPALTLDEHAVEHATALLARHPQLALLERQEAAARAEADIARSEHKADWSVELMYSQRGPAYSNMASLNVSIPLQWDAANRQDRQLAARLALADQVRAEREDAQREHLAETLTWLQQWHSNRERLAFYDSTLVPLSTERVRASLASYRGGEAALTTVLEARRLDIELRIDRLRLEMDGAGWWARIEYLVPPTTPAHKAPAAGRATHSLEPQR